MALMFQQLAHNFAKNGYYPTDSATIESILNKLSPCQSGAMRIIDPCAGEGTALAECQHFLHQPVNSQPIETFGVEYDKDRSVQAKKLLNRCLYGDFQDTIITPRRFGLLWLNPPYGDLVGDKGQTGSSVSNKGKKRLEKVFYQRSARLLQYGGVMVLIVPHYTLDSEFRKWIAAGFENVSVYLAPEQRFKQTVVMGVRRRTSTYDEKYKATMAVLNQFFDADIKLSPRFDHGADFRYVVPPAVSGEIRFNALRIDEQQLQEEIDKYPCLWPQFTLHMNNVTQGHRRPLMALSDWHLALALAAGQVSGIVHSNDGKKTYVIKGDTFKDKKQSTQMIPQGDGEFQEIRTSLDVFVPQIKAIDFTPGSETFGEILTIK
jgi:tRNA1(Val) A37 N6-methylase TrmN6